MGTLTLPDLLRMANRWADHYGVRHRTIAPRVRSEWWDLLQGHSREDVAEAMRRAHRHQSQTDLPGRMFSLAQIEAALSAIIRVRAEQRRNAAMAKKHAAWLAARSAEPAEPQRPITDAQARWIEAGGSELERLTRRWRVENSNRGTKGEPLTDAQAIERCRAVLRAVDGQGGD